jgi:nitrogen-specific signal transduction histidine kinase/CheY-like chemotaxis protein
MPEEFFMDMGIDCRKQMEKYLPPILIISADGSILDLTSNVSEYFPSADKGHNLYDLIDIDRKFSFKKDERLLCTSQSGKKIEISFEDCSSNLTAVIKPIAKSAVSDILSGEALLDAAEFMPVGIYEFDMNGVFVYVNKYLCDLFGYDKSEVLGESRVGEFMCHKRNGELFPAEIHSALNIKNGKPVGIMGIFLDATSKKRAEEELLKTNRIQSLGVIAGGIAHDFNNILTVIIGNISLAKFDMPKDSDSYKLLEEAESASVRAKTLTNQLSAFTKESEPVRENSNLEEIVRQSSVFVLSGSKSSCIFDFPKDLWGAEIDCGQFSRVIQNLVLNASQAMPRGGTITIKAENIRVTVDDHIPVKFGKYILLSIADEGQGIPPEIISKIFDPYFTTKETGSGLGLSVSFSVLKNHGGHITAESEEGKGCVIKIYIPASSSKQFTCRDVDTGDQMPEHLNIMIIDDDESIGKVTIELLRILGHAVYYFPNYDEAVEFYKEYLKNGEVIDVAIIDLTLPGKLSSEEILKELKAVGFLRGIISSGYVNSQVITDFRSFGFSSSIKKPFTIDELKRCLSEAFEI